MKHIKCNDSFTNDWKIESSVNSAVLSALMHQFNVSHPGLIKIDTLRIVSNNSVAFRARVFGMPGTIIGKGEIYAHTYAVEALQSILTDKYMKIFHSLG